MLKKLNLIIQIFIIKILLKTHCGEKVTLVGEGSEKKNCFWITIINDENDYLGIEKFEAGNFICKKFTEGEFVELTISSPNELVNNKIEFIHYFKHQEIKLIGFYKFLILFIPYKVTAFIWHYLDKLFQSLFNTRSLSSRKRYKLLAFLIDNFTGHRQGFTYIDVLQRLYGYRVFSHPNYGEIASRIIFNLDGLIDTQELKKGHQGNYYLTGHAHKSLDEYVEEDRRHKSMNFAQWVLIIVTIGLLFVTLIQAGVIKIPTILDLTK